MALLLVAAVTGGAADAVRAADGDTVVVGAGTVGGVYYPVAGALCQMVNGARAADEPTCVVVPGEGSKASLEALRAGRVDFAIAQSDWQYWAHKGAEFFADPKPFAELNSVFALHAEPLVIAVRRDADIASLADLKGKRFGIGAPATAPRGMVEALLGALGWSVSDFAEVRELAGGQQSSALCDASLDAAAFAVGSPSATLTALSGQCDVALLPLEGPAVEQLLADNPYYRTATVPAGIYKGVDAAVPTFGVGATLVTRADMPEAAVEGLLAAVFDNFEAFRALHPALTWLDRKQMAHAGLSAPLHPAAARFFADRNGS